MGIKLPEWAVNMALKLFDVEAGSNTAEPDMRIWEYSFALSYICHPESFGSGEQVRLLDVGCTARMNLIPQFACEQGWLVDGIDPRGWGFQHENFRLFKDISEVKEKYDLVTCISTLEHVGMKGRYGIKKQNTNADLYLLTVLSQLLKSNGILLITVPFTEKYIIQRGMQTYNYALMKSTLTMCSFEVRIINNFKDTLFVEAQKI